VDDDEMVLDANRQILERLGYQVSSFANSTAALDDFRNQPQRYDLVFSDLSMPGMDGVRLIDNIRQIRPGMPVILCTGYLENLNPADVEDLRVLRKPSSAADISQAIAADLQR
jgi:CheY-like chemotaxis protein